MVENKIKTNYCIVCDKDIPYSAVHRKYCRGNTCRKLFYHLKKRWKRNDKTNLSDEELILFDKLESEGAFENCIKKIRTPKPFVLETPKNKK